MRIVLDTNVVVSGLIKDTGAPADVVDLCIAGEVDMVVDRRILAEYEDVLRRPEFDLVPADVDEFLYLMHYAEHVVAPPLPITLTDPDDAPFMEVAVAAAVDAIVTGNAKHFRPLEGAIDIPVLTPREFLEHLASHY